MAANSRRRYHILLSSFTSEEKGKLSQSIQELGGTYSDTPHFIRSCSHVICGKPSRGEKFLCGCASGKWMLKREFIEDSIKAGRWLEEKLYEWSEQDEVDGVSASHIAAPGRWRRILQEERGPFDGWKALVAVADAKRRAAYKRLLEVGGAVMVSGKPPYPSNLASKLTHVFVEKAFEDDVKILQNAGVLCLSPDYIPEFILQDPAPPVATFSITSYESPVRSLQRITGKLKNTPVLGSDVTESRIGKQSNTHAMSTSRKIKASSVSLGPTEPPSKRQKQGLDSSFVNYRWQPRLSARVFSTSEVCGDEFPAYVLNSIDGYVEESHQSTVLDAISSFLTSKRYPPPRLLHTIMDILLKSSSAQAAKAFLLLQQLLVLHPPSHNTSLYQSMLNVQVNSHVTPVENIGYEWEFFKSLCSKKDQNSLLLLRFVITTLERDFHDRTCNSMLSVGENLDALKKSLLWLMFWPSSSTVSFNTRLRELFKLTWSACDDPNQVFLVQSLQSVVSMASECYILTDLVSFKCDEVGLGSRLSERSRTFVTELAYGGTHHEASMNCFLETCSPWLQMHIAEILLANYTDLSVPFEKRHLKSKTLSLEKIVCYHFFLAPRRSVDDVTPNVAKGNKCKGTPLQDIKRDNINMKLNGVTEIDRRNIKGETKLHVACIKNDAVKVKQLLAAGADANITDHAGWTPLHEACNHGHVECVRELLKARRLVYEINAEDDSCRVLNVLAAPRCGTTPLHDAAGNNHMQVVKELAAAGGIRLLEAKNTTGKKPLDVTKDRKITKFLQSMEGNNGDSSFSTHSNQVASKYTTQECEEFLLILSHLVQSYFRVTGYPTDNPLWTNFIEHVDNLESHLTWMLKDNHLSSALNIRLATLRMLTNT